MDFYGAVSAGASYVDSSPAASFTVRKAKKAAAIMGIDTWNAGQSGKFRPRRTRNAFTAVEKTMFRMDSLGEMGYFGAESARVKKRKKLMARGIDIRSVL